MCKNSSKTRPYNKILHYQRKAKLIQAIKLTFYYLKDEIEFQTKGLINQSVVLEGSVLVNMLETNSPKMFTYYADDIFLQ